MPTGRIDVIDSGLASAGDSTGNVSDLRPDSSTSSRERFFSRHVAQGQAERNWLAVQRVVRPSVHVIVIADSPSRVIDTGRISKVRSFRSHSSIGHRFN